MALTYKKSRGFTLIELLVTVAVFSAVTSVIVYNYSQFNTNVLITNYAYDVGLSIRQAQVYGVSVRENIVTNSLTNVTTRDFNGSYGVHFDKTRPDSLAFFADAFVPGATANLYDPDDSIHEYGELVDRRALPNNYIFSKFCAVRSDAGSTHACGNAIDQQGAIDFLDISFTRPEPDAIIRTSDPDSSEAGYYSSAFVCIESPLGKQRRVVVESTGQISVSSVPDDPECGS